jgi:hypothetical protein
MRRTLSASLLLSLCTLSSATPSLLAGDPGKRRTVERVNFGELQSPDPQAAREQALAWLLGTGKADAAKQLAFHAIWSGEKALLERVAETLALGDADARQLLAEAGNPNWPAPQVVPLALVDAKLPVYYRANLALAYAKALGDRRIYEESLAALRTTKPEMVVDPSTYLFTRAVAEHALLLKKDAEATIVRLLDDVIDAPQRHKAVAALMHFDMQNWRDKDLGWIARKMNNIERRLDLSRGGPMTQKIQKEVIMRLDELIKQLEQQGDGRSNGGNCPDGGNCDRPSKNIQSTRPKQDSDISDGSGPGKVDARKLKETAKKWGNLPDRERVKAMVELTKDLPPRHREIIEAYFKKLASAEK